MRARRMAVVVLLVLPALAIINYLNLYNGIVGTVLVKYGIMQDAASGLCGWNDVLEEAGARLHQLVLRSPGDVVDTALCEEEHIRSLLVLPADMKKQLNDLPTHVQVRCKHAHDRFSRMDAASAAVRVDAQAVLRALGVGVLRNVSSDGECGDLEKTGDLVCSVSFDGDEFVTLKLDGSVVKRADVPRGAKAAQLRDDGAGYALVRCVVGKKPCRGEMRELAGEQVVDVHTYVLQSAVEDVAKRRGSHAHVQRPSVVLVFLDSMSRSSFERSLPHTRALLDEMERSETSAYEAFDFRLHHVVGRSTYNTAGPMMYSREWPNNDARNALFDPVWEYYKRLGYVTAGAYSRCVQGDKGSKSPMEYRWSRLFPWYAKFPSEERSYMDVELSAFSCAVRHHDPSLVFGKNPRDARECMGGRHVMGHELDAARQMWAAKGDAPALIAVQTAVAHEPTGKKALSVDDDVRDFLLSFEKSDEQHKPIIFVHSDHGTTYGDFAATEAGRAEHSNPALYVLVPRAQLARMPHVRTALARNRDRVLTAFDLHLTLKQLPLLPDGTAMDARRTSRGKIACKAKSILEPMEHRTCAEAMIPARFCLCQPRTRLAVDDSYVLAVAGETVRKMSALQQQRSEGHRESCVSMELERVVSATRRSLRSMFDEGVKHDNRNWGDASKPLPGQLMTLVFDTRGGKGFFRERFECQVRAFGFSDEAVTLSDQEQQQQRVDLVACNQLSIYGVYKPCQPKVADALRRYHGLSIEFPAICVCRVDGLKGRTPPADQDHEQLKGALDGFVWDGVPV